MKFVIVFAALVAACAALPAGPVLGPDHAAVILKSVSQNDGIHGYQFDYETSNGIVRSETGVLKPVGEAVDGVIVVNGAASWTSPEGIPVSLKFVADENGYQPVL